MRISRQRAARRAWGLSPALLLAAALLLATACAGTNGGGAPLGDPAQTADRSVGGSDTAGAPDSAKPTDSGGGGADDNRPPTLHKIGDKVVPAGETLTIELNAEDPDGDSLVFSMFGQVPPGAVFDKNTHVFGWSPKQDRIGDCHFITFAVSDGVAFDRETVQLCVTEASTPHAPSFVEVSNQYPNAGEAYKLQIEATDADGDALLFSIDGPRPDGASIDPESGLFLWTPTESDAGPPVRVRFQVSDGELQDSMEVLFFVKGVGSTTHPPTMDPVPPQEVQPGATVSFVVSATDPDDDPLTYSMLPGAPDGAIFDAGARRFTWRTSPEQAGRVFEVRFEVSDGEHNALLAVEITVRPATTTSGCDADAFEPNDDLDHVPDLPVGDTAGLSICDEAAPGLDMDLFDVELAPGETLSVDVLFVHSDGDIDAALYLPGTDEPVVKSDTSTDDEHLTFEATEATRLILAIYGYDSAEATPQSIAYAMHVELDASPPPPSCDDDSYEENDTVTTAATLSASVLSEGISGLKVCADDEDWFRFDMSCGDELQLLLFFHHADGDLDIHLFDPTGELVLASGTSVTDDEEVTVDRAPTTGTYLLRVKGYSVGDSGVTYDLVASIEAGTACANDAQEPDNSAATATRFSPDDDYHGMSLCCEADWFQIPLSAGDALMAEATVASGELRMRLVASDGVTQVATSSVTGENVVSLETPPLEAGGDHYLIVEPIAMPATYDLDIIVVGGSGGACTAMSCPAYQVCDPATGACVSDWCSAASDCPDDYACEDSYCVNPCANDEACRTGYRCKIFESGRYCGPVASGANEVGGDCVGFDGCLGAATCVTVSGRDVCAQLDCESAWDCPWVAACATIAGETMCLPWCESDADCADLGMSCKPANAPDGEAADVCSP